MSFAAAQCYAPLRWSAEKPKRRGWWWLENNQDPVVLRVEVIDGDVLVFVPLEDWVKIERVAGRWAGPLPKPLEPSDVKPEHNASISDRREEMPDGR